MESFPAIKKWVFSFDQRASGWFEDMIKVAVISARENTELEPICLFDGEWKPSVVTWLEKNGVPVITTRVPFYKELYSEQTLEANRGTPYHPGHACGAFLRLISPDYVDDDYFLYTDCDVMFSSNPEKYFVLPRLLGACREIDSDGNIDLSSNSFNSGVLIVNKQGFTDRREQFIERLRSNNFYSKKHQSYDQTLLNLEFKDEWSPLARGMNWRAFEGPSDDAAIVHFHGPKPHRIAALLAGNASVEEGAQMADLINKHKASYELFVNQYEAYRRIAG